MIYHISYIIYLAAAAAAAAAATGEMYFLKNIFEKILTLETWRYFLKIYYFYKKCCLLIKYTTSELLDHHHELNQEKLVLKEFLCSKLIVLC